MDTRTIPLRSALTSRYLREPVIVLIAYFGYYLARHEAVSNAAKAFDNAADMIRLEQSLGIFKEISLQSAAFSVMALVHVFNAIYFYGHWPVIVIGGAYLFVKHPRIYTITRNAFLISGAMALVPYALFPVAPPRLIPGFVDTLSLTVPVSYEDSPLFNPYAALPSLHVGFDLLVALGLFLAIRHSLLRLLPWLLPPAMLLATVVTGNHYFLDGIAGALLCLAGFGLAVYLHRQWPNLEARLRTLVAASGEREARAGP
jgi:membrane-associated phospholipid phosphatase